MNWTLLFTNPARKSLTSFPDKQQQQIEQPWTNPVPILSEATVGNAAFADRALVGFGWDTELEPPLIDLDGAAGYGPIRHAKLDLITGL